MANKPVETRVSVWTAAALAPLFFHPAIRPSLLPPPATGSILESGAEATAVQTLRAFRMRRQKLEPAGSENSSNLARVAGVCCSNRTGARTAESARWEHSRKRPKLLKKETRGLSGPRSEPLCVSPIRIIEIKFGIQGCALAFAAACWMSASASGVFRSNVRAGSSRPTTCSLKRMSVKSPPVSRSTIRRVPFKSAAR